MADQPHQPDTGEAGDVENEVGSAPGIPRWVKVSGIVAIILALVVVIVLVAGLGGAHGPGRHTSSGSAPAGVVYEGDFPAPT
jgi:hypothetical protein